jgi:hypothetical protein
MHIARSNMHIEIESILPLTYTCLIGSSASEALAASFLHHRLISSMTLMSTLWLVVPTPPLCGAIATELGGFHQPW